MIAQWLVTLGVWYALLVDVLGNWAGQDHYAMTANWTPIVAGTTAIIVFLHGVMIGRLRR